MHGEHAIEELGRNQIVVRPDELQAHDGRLNAADNEKEQREYRI